MTDYTNIPLENAYETTLAASISASATSIVVDTAPQFTLPVGQTVDAVIDPENSLRERVIITAISGTTWTVTRGAADYLGDSGTAVGHGGGATVVITDSWSVFNDIATAVNSKIDTADGQLAVYANAAARDAAITTPVNGMQCYLTDTGKFSDYTAGSWVDRESGGTFANASTTVAGKVEEATAAQVVAKTGTGETGARMFIAPDNSALIDDSAGVADAGKLPVLDSNGRLKASMSHLDAQSLEDDGSDNIQVKLDPAGGITKGASGLASNPTALNTTAYTYGEAITTGDVLYLLETDNKVYKITSDPETWKTIVGVADEDGVLDDNKRVKVKGLVDGSFSAVAPVFTNTGGAASFNINTAAATDKGRAWRLDNTAGPEAIINGSSTVSVKKTGTPSAALSISLVLGSATIPYCGLAPAGNSLHGMVLATTTIAAANIDNTFDDKAFTFTNVVIPANTSVWIVFWTNAAASGANYYTIEGTAAAGGAVLVQAAAAPWAASNFVPNLAMAVSSVNPWEKRYAVRAYNGTAGGAGIGDNAATLPWNRVIGHVVSATKWYLDLDNAHTDAGNFTDAQDDSTPSWLYQEETTNFRPSWIDFEMYSLEATVDTRTTYGYSNYIADAVLANSIQGLAFNADLLGVPAVASVGTQYPCTATTTSGAYYVIPLENGFILSDLTQNPAGGSNPWPSANLLTIGVKYTASQK